MLVPDLRESLESPQDIPKHIAQIIYDFDKLFANINTSLLDL